MVVHALAFFTHLDAIGYPCNVPDTVGSYLESVSSVHLYAAIYLAETETLIVEK